MNVEIIHCIIQTAPLLVLLDHPMNLPTNINKIVDITFPVTSRQMLMHSKQQRAK